MNRHTLRKIHLFSARTAFLLIALFWTSSVISELLLSKQAIITVKSTIVYAMILVVISMAMAGITGAKMSGKSQHKRITAKRKRMPFIAANGLFILIPCAIFLYTKAIAGEFDVLFYLIQGLELLAGAINLILMTLSMRDGQAIRQKKG